MSIASNLRKTFGDLGYLELRIKRVQEALGRIEARQLAALNQPGTLNNEFRVHSQWGEDGIIQYLLRHLAVTRKVFIEFGVENYTESNTRFLLTHNNWSGLVFDGAQSNIDYIRNDPIYWQYNLKAEQGFITRENINAVIERNGVRGEIGLLSVDIDGNDYWVWEATSVVQPAIVIVEYNARFGPDAAVTIPYDATFVRATAHHSMIYYGASLSAFCLLGHRMGYALIGCNTAGNNAFFVRRDLLCDPVCEISPQKAFVQNQFREMRDSQGKLTYGSLQAEQQLLSTLPLVDVRNGSKAICP